MLSMLSFSLGVFLLVSPIALAQVQFFTPCTGDSDCGNNYDCHQLLNDGELDWVFSSTFPISTFCSDDDDCGSSSECPLGSACVQLVPDAVENYCVPCDAISAQRPLPLFIDTKHQCSTSPTQTPLPSPTIFQDTSFKQCVDDSECEWGECEKLMNDGDLSWIFASDTTDVGFCAGFDDCSDSRDCAYGTACVKLLPNVTESFCVPCNAIGRRQPSPTYVDNRHFCPTDGPKPSPDPVLVPASDDTFKKCTEDSDCRGSLDCVEVNNDGSTSWSCDSSSCICFDDDSCSSSTDCSYPKACVYLVNGASEAHCVACNRIPFGNPKPIFVDDKHFCDLGPQPAPSASSDAVQASPSPIKSPGASSGPSSDAVQASPSPIKSPGASSGPAVNSPGPAESQGPSSQPSTEEKRMSFEGCTVDSDCESPRTCKETNVAVSDFADYPNCDSSSASTCLCVPPSADLCSSSKDCDMRERCFGTDFAGICVSCSANIPDGLLDGAVDYKDNGEGNCPVCIAVSSLHGIAAENLVFKEHKRASVLCDKHENCATEGHMIMYEGRAMMMSTYCAMPRSGGCSRRIMFVNSPKMKVGLRIASKVNALVFTALAASGGSAMEEAVLAGVLHIGI